MLRATIITIATYIAVFCLACIFDALEAANRSVRHVMLTSCLRSEKKVIHDNFSFMSSW